MSKYLKLAQSLLRETRTVQLLTISTLPNGRFSSQFVNNRNVYSGILKFLKKIGMSKGYFYAVKRGKKVGIYRTWDECKEQTQGFSNARYKKFSSKELAREFIDAPDSTKKQRDVVDVTEFQPLGESSRKARFSGWKRDKPQVVAELPVPPLDPIHRGVKRSATTDERRSKRRKRNVDLQNYDPKYLSVYTDGACEQNGRRDATAGIGVFWGPGHHMNVSEPLPGRQTNNRAEIHSAIKAIKQAKSLGLKVINLHTDSKFLIKGATEWMHKWKRNNWVLSTGGPVKNKEDFEVLDAVLKGIKVNWIHVPGHAGVAGNEEADKLAREGCQKKKYNMAK